MLNTQAESPKLVLGIGYLVVVNCEVYYHIYIVNRMPQICTLGFIRIL